MPLCVVYEQWSRLITSAGLFWSHGGNRRRFMARWWRLFWSSESEERRGHRPTRRTRWFSTCTKNTFHTNLSPRDCENDLEESDTFDFQCPVINEVASKPPPSYTSQTAESAHTRSRFAGITQEEWKPRQARRENTTVTLYLQYTDMIK